MGKLKLYCPFTTVGCKTPTQVCMFWGERKACDLSNAVDALKQLPNLLRRIERELERGRHLATPTL